MSQKPETTDERPSPPADAGPVLTAPPEPIPSDPAPAHLMGRADAERAFGEAKFGEPGRPLRRNPFLIGFLGGLGLAVAYAVFLGLSNASSVLVLVFIALFLAVGLHPAVVRLQRWRVPRGLAVALVVLFVVGLIVGGITALVPPIVTQVGGFVEQLPSYVEALQRSRTLRDLIQDYDLVEKVQALVSTENASRVFGGVFGGARLFFGTVFNVLTVLILTIYFLASFERMKRAGYLLVPASRRARVQLIGDEILAKVGAYLVGALAIALLCGLSTFVFALTVGLPYPFALAIVVAICDLVPQIGATLGAVVVSLVGLATSLPIGIACIVFFLLYQQIENYLIYPKVMRRSVEVSDVAAIVAALLGVSLFGIIGALVAIPAVAALQIIIREVLIPRQATR
ncbi:AI-2E family transporter [Catenuloplanes indicus JCM 9534]|uniref:PurR-regulated permease PerM n=2 Tax=Catenuloplanes indicus TaxID=137267 RepID=A0AAE4B0P4_9ACTN|nr:putative PurR-regulated permease PerM [Catenuloplanes indicus]